MGQDELSRDIFLFPYICRDIIFPYVWRRSWWASELLCAFPAYIPSSPPHCSLDRASSLLITRGRMPPHLPSRTVSVYVSCRGLICKSAAFHSQKRHHLEDWIFSPLSIKSSTMYLPSIYPFSSLAIMTFPPTLPLHQLSLPPIFPLSSRYSHMEIPLFLKSPYTFLKPGLYISSVSLSGANCLFSFLFSHISFD